MPCQFLWSPCQSGFPAYIFFWGGGRHIPQFPPEFRPCLSCSQFNVFIGDFIINWLDESNRRSLYNLVVNCNYRQLISTYTTDNHATIDNIYTNLPESQANVHILETYFSESDHKSICALINSIEKIHNYVHYGSNVLQVLVYLLCSVPTALYYNWTVINIAYITLQLNTTLKSCDQLLNKCQISWVTSLSVDTCTPTRAYFLQLLEAFE